MSRNWIVFIVVFFFESVCIGRCYSQDTALQRPVIIIGQGSSAVIADNHYLDSMNKIVQSMEVELQYYKVEAIFSVNSIQDDSILRLIDVKVDSLIDCNPSEWINTGELITMFQWADDKYNNESAKFQVGDRFYASLQSYSPKLAVGHGEDYIVVRDTDYCKQVEVPFSKIKKRLMVQITE